MGCKSEVRVPVCLGSGDSAMVVHLASFLLPPQKDSEPALQPLLITALFPFVTVQLSHLYTTTEKTIALTIRPLSAKWCLCFLVPCLGWTIKIEELILLNGGAGEDSWKSFGQQEIKPVNPKGNPPWIFIGRTDAEAEALILWLPDVKSWLIAKDPDAGKDWGQEEKRVT